MLASRSSGEALRKLGLPFSWSSDVDAVTEASRSVSAQKSSANVPHRVTRHSSFLIQRDSMSKRPSFPFVPKSTAYLEPGHFWSIPMCDGRFACGRVIQLRMENGKRDSRTFLAGLMDWSACVPPTTDAISGRGVIRQGHVHVMTINKNGGEVVGFRDLALDRIEPWMFADAGWANWVQRGFDPVRAFDRKTDANLPVFSTWGFGVIKVLAEKHFRDSGVSS